MNKLRLVPGELLLALGIAVTLFSIASDSPPIKILVVIITIFVLVSQYLKARAYYYDFTHSNWVGREDGTYALVVPQSFHAKGKTPNVTTYEKGANNRYEQVECGIEMTSAGNVILISSQPIQGQARIY
jgi:hypothetical protein